MGTEYIICFLFVSSLGAFFELEITGYIVSKVHTPVGNKI